MLEMLLAKLDPKTIDPAEVHGGSTMGLRGARFESICLALSRVSDLSTMLLRAIQGDSESEQEIVIRLAAYAMESYGISKSNWQVSIGIVEAALQDVISPRRCRRCHGTGERKEGDAIEPCGSCSGQGHKLTRPGTLKTRIYQQTGKSPTASAMKRWFFVYTELYQVIVNLQSTAWHELKEAICNDPK
ncbi:hypothetical protein [Ferrimonas balearica]|uniref:hypothetical protein n=1 Tax=Ferrimonas balearica TaxID=44012 RepID=UPI001F165F9B|nr:hypothetical protein [Ferrimonas balearica]MBY6093812.1 hypothetical protein [Ferrimonas balearica]